MIKYINPFLIVVNIICASVLFSTGAWYVIPLGLCNVATAVFKLQEYQAKYKDTKPSIRIPNDNSNFCRLLRRY